MVWALLWATLSQTNLVTLIPHFRTTFFLIKSQVILLGDFFTTSSGHPCFWPGLRSDLHKSWSGFSPLTDAIVLRSHKLLALRIFLPQNIRLCSTFQELSLISDLRPIYTKNKIFYRTTRHEMPSDKESLTHTVCRDGRQN
jgi:hypothetical protein